MNPISGGDVEQKGPEIIFGLVAALGTDLSMVCEVLSGELRAVAYNPVLIHLSQQISEIDKWSGLPLGGHLEKYIHDHQEAGNAVRTETKLGDALARLGIGAIRNYRESKTGAADKPLPRTAYIIRQLKHGDELELLRNLYGSKFYLIAAYSPRESRLQHLSSEIAKSHSSLNINAYRQDAERLINKDEHESRNNFGQHVRDTYPKADVFVDASRSPELKKSLGRFVELIFGNPFITPSRDEFSMFHAKAAALRSADLARQVGAVIATNDGTVVAVGTNEVPKAGGGQYWDGDEPDARDFATGRDQSREMRKTLLGDVLNRLRTNGWFLKEYANLETPELVSQAAPLMKETRLMGLNEFGRTVHAEMAAILDAARRGVAVEGKTLFSTTFPCQNCARHIIGAGISRVVYIEPYPKSLATKLHDDSICVEGNKEGKVSFVPFIGIAPRQYLHLFEMVERRKNDAVQNWSKHEALPRYASLYHSFADYLQYMEREVVVLDVLKRSLPK